eukprot:1149948-Pelagomonas_calceolata.AAC.7
MKALATRESCCSHAENDPTQQCCQPSSHTSSSSAYAVQPSPAPCASEGAEGAKAVCIEGGLLVNTEADVPLVGAPTLCWDHSNAEDDSALGDSDASEPCFGVPWGWCGVALLLGCSHSGLLCLCVSVRLRAAFWVGPGGVADEGAGEAALYEPDEAQAKALGVG